MTPEDKYHLVRDQGRFIVAYYERGKYREEGIFETENAACEWLWEDLSKPSLPLEPSDLSEGEIEARGAAMRARYAEEMKKWPTWADQGRGTDDG